MNRVFPVFDLHCDTPFELYVTGQGLEQNQGHVSLARGKLLEKYSQVYAFCVFGGVHASTEPSQALFGRMWENFRRELEKHRLDICPEKALLALEGPEAIGCDPERLPGLRQKGFFLTTLTWNRKNPLAGSHLTGEGLTGQGIAFARQAWALGMGVDVSHLSDKAFWQLAELGEGPILASHSNSRAVCGNSRNLTDDQFRAIRDRGGLVGVNLYSLFLCQDRPATLTDVCRHMEHFLDLGGENCLALGGDLDGCDSLPQGFTGLDSYNRLGQTLQDAGFGDRLIEKIFYDNAAAFFRRL